MRTRYLQICLSLLSLFKVRCQTDMFELHDKERGKMELHVTKDKVEVEATSDSVNVVMNPDDAPGRKRSDSHGIARDNSTGGLTVGNIDQSDISVTKSGESTGNKRTVEENASNMEPTSTGRKNIPLLDNGVLDTNVKRRNLPIKLFDKLRGEEPRFKVYDNKKMLHLQKLKEVTGIKKSLRDINHRHLFQIPHDVNGCKREDEEPEKKSLNVRTLFRQPKHSFMNRKHKDLSGTKKSMFDKLCRFGRNGLPQRRKRSRMKEMTIHNELGNIRIKSNHGETALTSESGNLEVNMVNNQGEVAKKDTGLANRIRKPSKVASSTGISREIITEDIEGKIKHPQQSSKENRVHLAEYEGLKRTKVRSKKVDHHVVGS